jgi:hypothetical protein
MEEATTVWPVDETVGTVEQVSGPKKGKRGRKPLPEGERAVRRKKYWDAWYQDHKAEIAKKRARLWREDPEYRKRENARRRKQRRNKSKAAGKRPRVAPWAESTVQVAGIAERAYTLGYVAQRLGCSEALLRLWRWRGQLPESPFRIGRVHLYTQAMVDAVVEARDRRAKVRAGKWSVGSAPGMGDEIAAAWAAALGKEKV